MGLQGKLSDMSLGDLVQHACQERKNTAILVQQDQRQAAVYIYEGEVAHASLDGQAGEDVFYQLLAWNEGEFTVEASGRPSITTINRPWASLLLEGARRLDEASNPDLFVSEGEPMATEKRSEQIATLLAKLLQESSDISGAAIVGVDGLVYSANVPQKDMDEEMVGAVSAAVLGLCKRSAKQLKRGLLKQTLIQGEDGNIVVTPINDETLFVSLTPPAVNLGMAFAEVREMTSRIRQVL